MAGKKSKKSVRPPFAVMISKALGDLRGFAKMSRFAIAKSIKANYGAENAAALRRALRTGVAIGQLTAIKGSFRLAPGARQKPKKKVSKKKAPKKSAGKKKSARKKKSSSKKKSASKKKGPKKSVGKKKAKKTVGKKKSGGKK